MYSKQLLNQYLDQVLLIAIFNNWKSLVWVLIKLRAESLSSYPFHSLTILKCRKLAEEKLVRPYFYDSLMTVLKWNRTEMVKKRL